MSHHKCLDLEEYLRLVDYRMGIHLNDEPVEYIEDAENWSLKLIGLNFILSRLLEIKNKQKFDVQKIIDLIYSLPEQIFFEIEETGNEFIGFMLNKDRPEGSIEEMLIELKNDLIERIY